MEVEEVIPEEGHVIFILSFYLRLVDLFLYIKKICTNYVSNNILKLIFLGYLECFDKDN